MLSEVRQSQKDKVPYDSTFELSRLVKLIVK